MKKMNIAFACVFSLIAGQQLQAIDLKKIIVGALSLESSKNQQAVIFPKNNADKELTGAAQQQWNVLNSLQNFKNAKADDAQNSNHYYLRGTKLQSINSEFEPQPCDCDQC